ncbi:hypothetical protein [Streptomyces sp. ME109]|nr:hypothetical protein [Streptomyces sp. me109]
MTGTQDTPRLTAAEPLVRKVWEGMLQHGDFTDDDRFFSCLAGII